VNKFSGDYPPEWTEIAKSVKDEAGWRCVRCGHPHEPKAGYTLTVHHLTGDKGNCAWWNLAPLCQRCHLTIQARVVMDRAWYLPHSDWFKPYVAGYYAHVNGLDADRAFVMEHMEELLEIGQMAA
jgi:hypothetical protein